MADYITDKDIKDAVLTVSDADVAAGNDFIELMAARRDVPPDKIRAGFFVKRLGVCYACYTACLMATGTDATVTMENGGESIHERKLKLYGQELKRLMAEITARDFTGKPLSTNSGAASIGLWRT